MEFLRALLDAAPGNVTIEQLGFVVMWLAYLVGVGSTIFFDDHDKARHAGRRSKRGWYGSGSHLRAD